MTFAILYCLLPSIFDTRTGLVLVSDRLRHGFYMTFR
nr:MAG TPA: TOXIN TOXIN, ION CHANNEL MODULATOR.8A [Caudoviricetes sp.]